jgi:hypothetical protein
MRAMLSLRPLASSALALLGLAATLGLTRTAHAGAEMTISQPMTFGDDILLDTLTIESTGVLNVKSVRGKGKGRIRIAANTIIIKSGGKIIATGAGSLGMNGADGSADAPGGGGKYPMTPGHPGGGGGYFGVGASGASDMCVPFGDAGGGVAFAMPTFLLPILGSGGGAANVMAPATAGGDGGGIIEIEAANIQFDGTIESRGTSPPVVSGVARGGGSGGFVAILATHLTGTGTIDVSGGDGTAAPGNGGSIPATNGGGGAGGVILVKAIDVTMEIQKNFDVKGGATGACGMLAAADGMANVDVSDATFCVDADQDKHPSTTCGGDDCDDSRIDVNPAIKEICNGIDDNCLGGIDEGASICPAGQTCGQIGTKTTCIDTSDAGTDAGAEVDAGAPPDHIAFESGCAFEGDGGGWGALATAAFGATALAARRRRAARSTRTGR